MPSRLFAEPFLGNSLESRNFGRIDIFAATRTNLRIGEILFSGFFGWKFEPLSRPRCSLRPVIQSPWTVAPATPALGLVTPLYGCHCLICLVVNFVSLHS